MKRNRRKCGFAGRSIAVRLGGGNGNDVWTAGNNYQVCAKWDKLKDGKQLPQFGRVERTSARA
jgi:hypothetical protein